MLIARWLVLLLVLVASGRAAAHGPIDDALVRASDAVASAPDAAEPRLQRAELWRVRGDYSAAEAELARAQELGADAQVHFYRGRLRLDSGDAKGAAESLERFAAVRPNDAQGHAFHGRALAQLGRTHEAVAAYDRALARAARSQFYFERARILGADPDASDEQLARALAGLDEARERLGLVTPLELYAIELELRRGRHDDALARLERLEARADAKVWWVARRAEILEDAGRPEAARRAWLAARASLEELPSARRQARTGEELERSIRSALERLEPQR